MERTTNHRSRNDPPCSTRLRCCGPAAQDVPTVFRNSQSRAGFELTRMRGGEALRRSAIDLFEFAAEMRFISELQFVRGRFVGVALGNEVFGQTALQFAQPMAGSATKVLPEQPLQLTLGNGAKRRHFGGVEIRLARHLFPLLDCQQASVHRKSL